MEKIVKPPVGHVRATDLHDDVVAALTTTRWLIASARHKESIYD